MTDKELKLMCQYNEVRDQMWKKEGCLYADYYCMKQLQPGQKLYGIDKDFNFWTFTITNGRGPAYMGFRNEDDEDGRKPVLIMVWKQGCIWEDRMNTLCFLSLEELEQYVNTKYKNLLKLKKAIKSYGK